MVLNQFRRRIANPLHQLLIQLNTAGLPSLVADLDKKVGPPPPETVGQAAPQLRFQAGQQPGKANLNLGEAMIHCAQFDGHTGAVSFLLSPAEAGHAQDQGFSHRRCPEVGVLEARPGPSTRPHAEKFMNSATLPEAGNAGQAGPPEASV